VRTVLVAVDGSPTARRAAALAGEISLGAKARCILVHVRATPSGDWDRAARGDQAAPSRPTSEESEWLSEVRHRGPKDAELVILEGSPVEAVLTYAQKNPPDLLVCGRRGSSPTPAQLLGGVSSALLQHARCPVLVVP